jgi:hypothetical protein
MLPDNGGGAPAQNREGVMADRKVVATALIFAVAATALAALVIIIGTWLNDGIDLAPTAHLSH